MGLAVTPTVRKFGAVLIVCIVCLGVTPARADTSGWERFSLTVSGYQPSIDTQVRFDASNQLPGTNLDLEDDLQLNDSETLTQYYASLHIMRDVSLEGSYFEFGRFMETVLSGPVQFGDTMFPVSTNVATHFEAGVTTLALRWTFFRTDRTQLAATAGGYWMSLQTGIDSAGGGLAELAEADALLPMAGLFFGWNLTQKLQLTASGDYLSIDDDDLEGSISSYRASLQYRVLEKLGIGIGYDVMDVEVESVETGFPGFFSSRQQGPMAFMTLRF